VASGVPPLVLFTIAAVAAAVDKLSWLVWTLSIALRQPREPKSNEPGACHPFGR
jgi:hypothetical protein